MSEEWMKIWYNDEPAARVGAQRFANETRETFAVLLVVGVPKENEEQDDDDDEFVVRPAERVDNDEIIMSQFDPQEIPTRDSFERLQKEVDNWQ